MVQALETVGLTLDDFESVPLAPADARAAFQGGNLDAWAIWDPFLTSATQELEARTLITRYDVGEYRWFYLASQTFTEDYPDVLNVVLEQLQVATDWIRDNPDGYADYSLPKPESQTRSGPKFSQPVSLEIPNRLHLN